MAEWMAFNVADYLLNTLHLTARQHGGYILLICAAWNGKGKLPGNDAALMAIAKLSAREWQEDGDVLKDFLTHRDGAWVHERVEFEWESSRRRIDAKSTGGRKGAKARWEGRAGSTPNGKAIAKSSGSDGSPMSDPKAPHKDSQRDDDAHLHLHLPDVTTASSVSDSARATDGDPGYDTAAEPVDDLAPPTTLRRLSPGRAQPIPEDWLPAEDTQRELAKSRPDLTPERINQRTIEFRAWCLENNTQSHNFDASWLKFMVKTYAERTSHPSQVHSQRSPAHDGIRAARARRSVLAGD